MEQHRRISYTYIGVEALTREDEERIDSEREELNEVPGDRMPVLAQATPVPKGTVPSLNEA